MIHVFPNSKQVTVKTEIEDFMLSVKILSDLGIIVTELITNAMKYAFSEDRCGVIRFQLFQRDTQFVLKLCNNGVPLPDNFSPENTGGFGLQLVSMLVQQLKGALKVHTHEETCFVIEFPKPETEG
jgi:two-component sensor histidine kinase